MAGGGSSGTFGSRTPEDMRRLVRKAEEETSVAEFEAEVSKTLGELLAGYNDRDVDLVKERLENLKDILEGQIEGTFDQLYGGSVAKRTYVDGLSDIDSLLIISGTELEGASPRVILDKLSDDLTAQISHEADVTAGRMAVTVEFRDGMSIQLLPALRTEEGLKVPSARRDGWSEINPETFQAALIQRNQECGGKLVPVVKLVKAIIGTLPESQQLTGYHVESLAISAFRNYDGPKTSSAMLPRFFEKAKDLVLTPIKDSTGQSVHVDSYLGAENSSERASASHLLGRLGRRMRNATAAGSKDQWLAMFDADS